MGRSSLILLGLIASAVLAVIIVWTQFIPDRVKEAISSNDRIDKQSSEFVKENIEEIIFLTKRWPVIAKAAGRGKLDESFCNDGGGEKFWGEDYLVTCIALVRKQYELCSYMKERLGDDDKLSLKMRQCIEHVRRFTSQKPTQKTCEPLREFQQNPEDYINCRAWIDAKHETCLYLAQYTDNIRLRYTQTVMCMVNLARYTHSMAACDAGREFYDKYKGYLNTEKVEPAVNNCYRFK